MDTKTLVSDDTNLGRLALEALDKSQIKVSAAFWLYYGDTGVWKLWIATPEAGTNLQDAYVEVAQALSSFGPVDDFDLSRIRLVTPNDPMVRALNAAIRVDGTSQVRFSRNVINGIYIEDAIIYRLNQNETKVPRSEKRSSLL
jgi:hypothetical protein